MPDKISNQKEPPYFEVRETVFDTTLCVFHDCIWEEVVAFLKIHKPNHDIEKWAPDLGDKGSFVWSTSEEGSRLSIIHLIEKDESVIVHEVFHAAHRMLEHRGVKLCDETSEVYAYFYTNMLLEVKEKLNAFHEDQIQAKNKKAKEPTAKRKAKSRNR